MVNDYDVRVVKVLGEFTRHSHPETDEFFLVLSGALTIRMDDGDVHLGPGDTYVVPRGRPHPAHRGHRDTPASLRAERHRQHRRHAERSHVRPARSCQLEIRPTRRP